MTKNKPIPYKAKTKALVDIITPVYGGLKFIQGLAQSLLLDHDAGVNYHWYIIDDATPADKGSAEIIHYLRTLEDSFENVTFIQNKVNGGFAKSCNLAASKGRSNHILLLNSDTLIIQDNWLKTLSDNLITNPAVGIVGAKLLFFADSPDLDRPANKIQHAGVAFNILGHPYHIFMGWPSNHPKVNESRAMRAVTGACLLTRRTLWRRFGGLAEIYTKGNFEDVEYCLRSIAAGSIVLYDPNVTLYHYGSGSDNTETVDRNSQIFLLRNDKLLVWDDWRYY